MSLSIQHVSKLYGNGVKALDKLSLEIGRGMFGLLGPNGAGKSSLMRTVATLQLPDEGTLHFDDIDIVKEPIALRKQLGYLPQSFGVYPGSSAETLLNYFAALKGVASGRERKMKIQEVLELTNLYHARKKVVSSYSGGMRQRFGIAQLLLNNPRLLIVDEPTSGLDPAERSKFLNILREIGTESTVIFSTHLVADVRELCHELAIVNNGKVLLQQKPSEATNSLNGQIWSCNISKEQLPQYEEQHHVLSSTYNEDNTLSIRVCSSAKPSDEFTIAEPRLEDVYFMALHKAQQ
jgi:ABC-type multidrug transport system ATPase subunit